jgi:hypothetical protein
LFKPSIQLEEDITIPTPGISLGEDSPVPVLGSLSGKGDLAPTSEVNLWVSAKPIEPNLGHEGEIAVVVGLPDHEVD